MLAIQSKTKADRTVNHVFQIACCDIQLIAAQNYRIITGLLDCYRDLLIQHTQYKLHASTPTTVKRIASTSQDSFRPDKKSEAYWIAIESRCRVYHTGTMVNQIGFYRYKLQGWRLGSWLLSRWAPLLLEKLHHFLRTHTVESWLLCRSCWLSFCYISCGYVVPDVLSYLQLQWKGQEDYLNHNFAVAVMMLQQACIQENRKEMVSVKLCVCAQFCAVSYPHTMLSCKWKGSFAWSCRQHMHRYQAFTWDWRNACLSSGGRLSILFINWAVWAFASAINLCFCSYSAPDISTSSNVSSSLHETFLLKNDKVLHTWQLFDVSKAEALSPAVSAEESLDLLCRKSQNIENKCLSTVWRFLGCSECLQANKLQKLCHDSIVTLVDSIDLAQKIYAMLASYTLALKDFHLHFCDFVFYILQRKLNLGKVSILLEGTEVCRLCKLVS